MTKVLKSALMWFRRDLRLDDNAALFHALKAARQVHCVFGFDREILDAPPRRDRRVVLIHQSLQVLGEALRALGGGLRVVHGVARDEVTALAAQLGVQAVYANHDDEPQALARDAGVQQQLAEQGIAFLPAARVLDAVGLHVERQLPSSATTRLLLLFAIPANP